MILQLVYVEYEYELKEQKKADPVIFSKLCWSLYLINIFLVLQNYHCNISKLKVQILYEHYQVLILELISSTLDAQLHTDIHDLCTQDK